MIKADALMEKIESGKKWEPRMSRALEASIRIPEVCRLLLGKGAKSGSVGGTAPTMEICSLLSGIIGGSGLDLSSFLQQLLRHQVATCKCLKMPPGAAPGLAGVVQPTITPH